MTSSFRYVVCLTLFSAAVLSGHSLAQSSASLKAKKLVELAQDLGKRQDFDQAVVKMREAIKLDLKNDFYLQLLAHFEDNTGRHAEALEHVRQAIKLNDKNGYHFAVAAFAAYHTHDFSLASSYCQKVIALGPEKCGKGNCERAEKTLKDIQGRTYTIVWTLRSEKAIVQDGFIALPLPTTDLPYQRSSWEVSGVKEHKTVKRDDNDLLLVMPDGGKPFQLTAKVTQTIHSYKKDFARERPGQLPESVIDYLGPTERIDPKSDKVVRIAAEVKAIGTITTVENIVKWMKKHIVYKVEDFDNVDDLLLRGHAECGGMSAVFVALCRASGVPAREVWGVTNLDSRPDHLAGHAWAEFYLAGVGWIPIEPQPFGSVGLAPPGYVRMFHYDPRSGLRTPKHLRAPANLWGMEGNTPKYQELP